MKKAEQKDEKKEEDVHETAAATGKPKPKPEPPKDLIRLRNVRNGEVYRFACKTCIDGHRAPLCDPKKHRGKIMCRRPNPGRPARACCHPGEDCDCQVKRHLCAFLTSEEWDRVEKGEIPSVRMFDTREDLEDAHNGNSNPTLSSFSGPTPSPFSGSHPTSSPFSNPDSDNALHSHETLSSSHNGARGPRMSMAGNGVHQAHADHATHGPGPFSLHGPPGQGPPISHFGIPPQRSLPHHPHHSNPVSELEAVTAHYAALEAQFPLQAHFPNQGMDVSPMGMPLQNMQSGPVTPWPQPSPFDQSGSFFEGSAQHIATFVSGEMHMTPEGGAMPPNHALGPPTTHEQPQAALHQNMYFPSIDPATGMPAFAIDRNTDMLNSQFDAAQRPTTMENLSQSCCSGRSAPSPMNTFGNWNYPGSAPAQQFPCPRCASTQCTCTDCPEVMQDYGSNGAWSRACGRDGHLDASQDFSLPAELLQPQSMPPPPQPMTKTKSCCNKSGNGTNAGTPNSGVATEESSPFIQPRIDSVQFPNSSGMDMSTPPPPQWQQHQHQQEQPIGGGLPFRHPSMTDMFNLNPDLTLTPDLEEVLAHLTPTPLPQPPPDDDKFWNM